VITSSSYIDMPLSLVLFRYVWPFWLFKDAARGDRYARAAAYRHNRDMRIHLPGYLMIKPLHKMSERQVGREMQAAGFKHVKTVRTLPLQHLMIFEAAL